MKVPATLRVVLWCSMLAPAFAVGQGIVTARVIDGSTKKPVRNATVKVADTALQTTTNFLGFFQLAADSTKTLLVYQAGYDTAKVKVPPVSKFQIELFRDTIPEYEGGMKAFYDFMGKNLRYPPDAHEADIQGWVYVAFDVDSLVGTQNIRVICDLEKHCGEEVASAIKSLPNRWLSKSATATFILPVLFRLGFPHYGDKKSAEPVIPRPQVNLPNGKLLSEIVVEAPPR